jgi:hypothetical protein
MQRIADPCFRIAKPAKTNTRQNRFLLKFQMKEVGNAPIIQLCLTIISGDFSQSHDQNRKRPAEQACKP